MAVLDKTQDEILNNLGTPSEKKTEGYYEEWFYYDFGQEIISLELPSASKTNIRANPVYGTANRSANVYEGGIVSREMNDYIIITFQNGRVIKWATAGIEYKVEEISPIRTVFFVLGTVALSVGFALLMSIAG